MINMKSLLRESFDLPPEVNQKCELLAKFIASFFINSLKNKTQNIKTKSDKKIVRQNMEYNLATLYRAEGKKHFVVDRHPEDTKWGEANIRIISKEDGFPDTILYISTVRTVSDDGYVDDVEEPQQIYILVDSPQFLKNFEESIKHLTDTIKHETRHWIQLTHDIGLPKEKILNRKTDVFGHALKPTLKNYYTQQQHHMRDIEFKPNVHTYAFRIKEYLNKTFPKHQWKNEFKQLITYKRPDSHDESITLIMTALKHMYNKDKLRWRQFVKELYSLIF